MENLQIHIGEIEFTINPFQFDEIWKHIALGKWEPESFAAFKKFIKESDVVIDLGSWAGPLTIYAAHLASFVHSIDPDPVIFKQLVHNVNLNPQIRNKVKCHNIAIWNSSSTQTLFSRNVFGDSASSLIQRTRDGNDKTIVQTISFKEFLEREKITGVDFIKMDTEGAELFFLPSIKNELAKLNFPTLLISFHTEYLTEYLFQRAFRNKLLSKILFKICKELSINIFSKRIEKVISESVEPLKDYQFLYESGGREIYPNELLNYIKRNRTANVVFTNNKW
jgi:FkbM family methyltransferase